MAENPNTAALSRALENAMRQHRGGGAELATEFRSILSRDVAEVAPGQDPNRFERHFEAQRLGSGELSARSIRTMNTGAARRTDAEWQEAFTAASERIGTALPESARRIAAEAFRGASTELTCDTLHETNGGQRPGGPAPNLPEFQPGGRCK